MNRFEEAKEMYELYSIAEKAILTGQEYRIGSRFVKRADLAEVSRQRKYWRKEMDYNNPSVDVGRRKVRRTVIRDD